LGFSLKNVGLDRFTVGQEMMSEVGFSVSQMIPFPGKLRLKSAIASSQALQVEETLKAARLSLVREIKEFYAKLFYYQKSLKLLQRKKDVLRNALQISEVKYSVGVGVQSDLFKAQVEISGIEEMILTMEQMARTTRANINSLLDLPPESPLGNPKEIDFYELKADLNTLQEQAQAKSPVLKEAQLMIDQGEIEVKMAKKEYYPNFMIQVGKGFKGALPDMYEVMVGVEVPLYYKKKQANLLEESVSRLSSSKNQYTSMKNEIAFMLTESYTMAQTSASVVALYKDKILPQARLAYESSLANYRVNRVDFLMLLSDINSLFTYEMEYFRNLSNLWASAAKVEELTSQEFIR
jgi:outer membrane protein TolC